MSPFVQLLDQRFSLHRAWSFPVSFIPSSSCSPRTLVLLTFGFNISLLKLVDSLRLLTSHLFGLGFSPTPTCFLHSRPWLVFVEITTLSFIDLWSLSWLFLFLTSKNLPFLFHFTRSFQFTFLNSSYSSTSVCSTRYDLFPFEPASLFPPL